MVKMTSPLHHDKPTTASLDTPQSREHAITSTELLRGRNEVLIIHRGEHYRLRRTSTGKLILTK